MLIILFYLITVVIGFYWLYIVRVAFDAKSNVSAVKFHVYGSDAVNVHRNNGVTELIVLSLKILTWIGLGFVNILEDHIGWG